MASSAEVDLYGVRVNLWLKSNDVEIPFRSIAGNATDYIDSVSIRIGLMEILHIDLKITPPIQDAIALLKSGKIGLGFSAKKNNSKKTSQKAGESISSSDSEFGFNRMVVQIDYGGRTSPKFEVILLMPELSLGEEGIEITMKGFGLLFESGKEPIQIKDPISGTEAIKKYFSDGKNVSVKFEAKAQAILDGVKHTNMSGKNPIESAAQLLKENSCKFFYKGTTGQDHKPVVMVTHVDDRRKDKFCTFVAFKQIDPNNGIYPILSMDTNLSNLMASQVLMGAKNVIVDKANKLIDSKPIEYGKEATSKVTTPDGSAPGNGIFGDNPVGAIFSTISSGGPGMISTLKGVVTDWMEKAFEYRITSICIADLLPGRMVGINIADIDQLKGDYDLFTVEHTVSSSGAETHMEIKGMGGLASTASQGLNKAIGKIDAIKNFAGGSTTKTSKAAQ